MSDEKNIPGTPKMRTRHLTPQEMPRKVKPSEEAALLRILSQNPGAIDWDLSSQNRAQRTLLEDFNRKPSEDALRILSQNPDALNWDLSSQNRARRTLLEDFNRVDNEESQQMHVDDKQDVA